MTVLHLETLVGKEVVDAAGAHAGRLEEVHADWRGNECMVTHYVLATSHRIRKPLIHALIFALRQLGAQKWSGTVVVPWDKLDLSDPEKPRLLNVAMMSGAAR